MLAVQLEPEGRQDLYHLLAQECPATCLVKVLATWSWQGRKRDRGLKVREVGGEERGGESLKGTEGGDGRRTGEPLMWIGTGGIEETLGDGEKVVVGGIITGEKGNGRKMRDGEGKAEEEGGRKEEEVKVVQEEAEKGAESEEGAMITGVLILLLEVILSCLFPE